MEKMLLELWRARSRLYGRRFFQVTLVLVTSIKFLIYTKRIFQALLEETTETVIKPDKMQETLQKEAIS